MLSSSVLTMLLVSGRWLLLSSSSFWTSGEGLGAGGCVMSAGREPGLPIQLIELPAWKHSHITASVCVWECALGWPAMLRLSGREPTCLFDSFTVRAVGILINHRALWENALTHRSWLSVWTYRLSVYRHTYWQLRWLSDSWRALPSSCSLCS